MNLQEIEAFAAKLKEKYWERWQNSDRSDFIAREGYLAAKQMILAAQDLQEIEAEEQK